MVRARTRLSGCGSGANEAWANNSANSLTFSGVISGAGNLTIGGSGVTVLSGANSYSGSTNVFTGTLRVSGATGDSHHQRYLHGGRHDSEPR